MEKRCSRCKITKSVEEFYKNRSTKDGMQSVCKPCQHQVRLEYEERHAEVLALRRAERLARRPPEGAMKVCRKCGETKVMLAFYAHRSTQDGRANYCMECQKATTRAWQKANADKVREYNSRPKDGAKKKRDHRQWWLRLYNLSQDDYARLLDEQGGVCAICHQPERYIDSRTGHARNLSVDHDHATGHVRGLLCGRCNRGLGQFNDDLASLTRAAEYLRKAATA